MTGPSLLIVEDEEPARHALAEYLERRGYEVHQADTAQEAIRQWDAHRADAVLLDLGLPDLDGVDVIRRIRREAVTPIIILSARGDERDKISGLEAGADDYLTKPFALDELNARSGPCFGGRAVPAPMPPAASGSARSNWTLLDTKSALPANSSV